MPRPSKATRRRLASRLASRRAAVATGEPRRERAAPLLLPPTRSTLVWRRRFLTAAAAAAALGAALGAAAALGRLRREARRPLPRVSPCARPGTSRWGPWTRPRSRCPTTRSAAAKTYRPRTTSPSSGPSAAGATAGRPGAQTKPPRPPPLAPRAPRTPPPRGHPRQGPFSPKAEIWPRMGRRCPGPRTRCWVGQPLKKFPRGRCTRSKRTTT
mmetsp:Transcript_39923/g.89482  ORF Transcript_39923/g.89482 Transcript_39923/m.89482 type:complete len:213 (+) Transcript_39923:370-1008(+)